MATVVVMLSLPLVAGALHQPFWINVATRVLIAALAAVSLDLIVGYGGMVSFGHAAYLALGGYTVAVLAANGIDAALVTWPAAVAVSTAFALAVGALSLRTAGISFIMITLAFAQMVYYATIAIKAFGGSDGLPLTARSVLPLLDLRDATAFYFVALALLVAFVLGCAQLVASRFGTVLRAGRRSERRLLALGFPVFRYRLVAFAIAGAGAGLAGALSAEFTRIVSPDVGSWQRSGELLIMVILGGAGSLVGAIYGAAVLLGLESLLAGWTEHWMLALGIVLLGIVLFAKRGLYGWLAGADG